MIGRLLNSLKELSSKSWSDYTQYFKISVAHFALFARRAGKRISAEQALRHRYFSDLPAGLAGLPARHSIYSVAGLQYCEEQRGGHTGILRLSQLDSRRHK